MCYMTASEMNGDCVNAFNRSKYGTFMLAPHPIIADADPYAKPRRAIEIEDDSLCPVCGSSLHEHLYVCADTKPPF